MNWFDKWCKNENAFEAHIQKRIKEAKDYDPECSPPIDAYPGNDDGPQDYSEIRGV